LGLPQTIIQAARQELNPQDLQADDLLNEIYRQRELAQQARLKADQALREAETLRGKLALRADQIEDERREILEAARQESAGQVQELEEEIRQVRRALARARQPLEALQAAEEKTAELQETVEKPVERQRPDLGLPPSRSIRLGDRVFLRTLKTQGIVTALGEEEAEVQVGVLRVRTRLADLELPGSLAAMGTRSEKTGSQSKPLRSTPVASPPKARAEATQPFLPASPGIELDLRGQRAEDALEALDRYLDQAYLAGLPFVRIIHGKGTGRLREVVRQELAGNPSVRSFESGGEKEGGEGVTVARLSTS
jgi:DNA mismatch repair protein MutS2